MTKTSSLICFCRWLYHHYFAMAMSLVSLTWEIKGQPNCVQKQVLGINLLSYMQSKIYPTNVIDYSKSIAERSASFPPMGYDARCRDASAK